MLNCSGLNCADGMMSSIPSENPCEPCKFNPSRLAEAAEAERLGEDGNGPAGPYGLTKLGEMKRMS